MRATFSRRLWIRASASAAPRWDRYRPQFVQQHQKRLSCPEDADDVGHMGGKVDRLCSMLCSSPISGRQPRTPTPASVSGGKHQPHMAIRDKRPSVLRRTVLRRLGPVITSVSNAPPPEMSMGTTRSGSISGWRAGATPFPRLVRWACPPSCVRPAGFGNENVQLLRRTVTGQVLLPRSPICAGPSTECVRSHFALFQSAAISLLALTTAIGSIK